MLNHMPVSMHQIQGHQTQVYVHVHTEYVVNENIAHILTCPFCAYYAIVHLYIILCTVKYLFKKKLKNEKKDMGMAGS